MEEHSRPAFERIKHVLPQEPRPAFERIKHVLTPEADSDAFSNDRYHYSPFEFLWKRRGGGGASGGSRPGVGSSGSSSSGRFGKLEGFGIVV